MKVVIAPLDKKTAREIGAKGSNAKKRRFKTRDGETKEQWVIDFASDTLSRDLTYVFGRNVAHARRENKRLLGSADGVVTDS